MSRIAKITTVVLVCGITLSAAAYFLRDTAVAGVVMNKVNTYRLNQGLVGWWTFDGTDVNFQTGRVADKSGNNNYGAIQNMSTSTSRVAGKVGQAMQFDGVDDEITTATAYDNPQDYTISVWFNTTEASGHALVGFQDRQTGASAPNYDRQIWIETDGTISHGWYSGVKEIVNSPLPYNDGNWHHAVGTHSSGGTGTLYIDGVLIGTDTGAAQNFTGYWRIATPRNVGWALDGFFSGKIDDVRIWNRALSPSEVKLLYTSTAGSKMNTSKNVIPGSSLQTGLVGLWSFDGPDLTDKVYDRSGQGNNGYFAGGATNTAKVVGKVGQALRFDGVDDHVKVTPVVLTATTNWTIGAWVRRMGVGDGIANVFVMNGVSGSNGQTLWVDPSSDELHVEHAGVGDQGTGVIVPLNEWVHLLCTRDTSTTQCYKNGTAEGVTSNSAFNAATTHTMLGGKDVGQMFDGKVDDVRIWNRALSAQEVKDLYTATAGTKVNHSQNTIPGSTLQNGLVGLWSFSGNDVTDRVYDTSGNGNNGYFEGNATNSAKTSGKSGQGMHFDGVDDFVDLGSPGSLDLAGAASFGAWVNLDDVMGDSSFGQYILAQGCGAVLRQFSLNVGGTAMGRGGAGKVHVFWPDANLHNLSIATLQPGRWYHLFSTRGGTSGNWTSRLYVNGVLDDETTGIATDPGVQCPTSIGRPGDYPYFYTHGKIDGVRLYNRELSASEVKLLYDSGQ